MDADNNESDLNRSDIDNNVSRTLSDSEKSASVSTTYKGPPWLAKHSMKNNNDAASVAKRALGKGVKSEAKSIAKRLEFMQKGYMSEEKMEEFINEFSTNPTYAKQYGSMFLRKLGKLWDDMTPAQKESYIKTVNDSIRTYHPSKSEVALQHSIDWTKQLNDWMDARSKLLNNTEQTEVLSPNKKTVSVIPSDVCSLCSNPVNSNGKCLTCGHDNDE